jgi:hypothetical protein
MKWCMAATAFDTNVSMVQVTVPDIFQPYHIYDSGELAVLAVHDCSPLLHRRLRRKMIFLLKQII